jgi:hypothetical protein
MHNAIRTDHFALFLMNIFVCIISKVESEGEKKHKKEMVSWSDEIVGLDI